MCFHINSSGTYRVKNYQIFQPGKLHYYVRIRMDYVQDINLEMNNRFLRKN